MRNYTIIFTRSARKELERLHINLIARILPRIEALANNPYPRGCQKVRGNNLWRIRVGDYRVIYAVDEVKQIVDISSTPKRSISLALQKVFLIALLLHIAPQPAACKRDAPLAQQPEPPPNLADALLDVPKQKSPTPTGVGLFYFGSP